jgi:hypothetical protein
MPRKGGSGAYYQGLIYFSFANELNARDSEVLNFHHGLGIWFHNINPLNFFLKLKHFKYLGILAALVLVIIFLGMLKFSNYFSSKETCWNI